LLPSADGEESLQDVWASQLSSSGASIAAADFCDPFALLLLSDGCGALLAADSANGRLSVDDSPAAAAALTPSSPKDRIVAASLFADACGWLAARLQPQGDGCGADSSAAASGTAYALLCRAGGTCQLYALPGWRLVWASAGSLADAPTLLTAAGDAYPGAAEAATSLDGAEAEVPGSGSSSEVVELRLVSFGPPAGGRRDVAAARGGAAPAAAAPLLLALTADHQLLAYRAFVAPGSSRDGSRVRLRFRRLPLDVPPLLPPAGSPADGSTPRLPRLHPFEGLGEEAPHSGVFVAGLHPHWLVAARGTLLAHPHHLQQTPGGPAAAAVGFTPFHNVNCPHGFILATGEC
jgi:cleavage and polyadenylation specificity factor subunit 1